MAVRLRLSQPYTKNIITAVISTVMPIPTQMGEYPFKYAGTNIFHIIRIVMAKEKINLFMKGKEADLNEIYKRFGVDYDLKLMYREQDDEGHFHIRWGKQEIAS